MVEIELYKLGLDRIENILSDLKSRATRRIYVEWAEELGIVITFQANRIQFKTEEDAVVFRLRFGV